MPSGPSDNGQRLSDAAAPPFFLLTTAVAFFLLCLCLRPPARVRCRRRRSRSSVVSAAAWCPYGAVDAILAMASIASSSTRTGRTLPLVDCPQCKVPVVKCRSKNGNVYYRCRDNFLNDDKCEHWWFEDAYELYLRDNHPHLLENSLGVGHNPSTAIQVVQQTPGTAIQGIQQAPGEMQMVAFGFKMQLGDIKLEIGMRSETKDPKDEVRRGNNPTVVFNVAVVCILLAMFVAVLVASVWKK